MRVFTLPAENWNELSIDKQVIRHLILKHRSLVDHLITLEDYYEGKHKILNDKNRENKLVCNHAKDISDTASSYFIGNPVTYKAQTDITDLTDKLEYAGADEADGDNGLDLSIFGRAYEYIYTKKDETDLMIKNLSPANTFVVYDDTIEQNELFAVYYYAKRDDSDRTDIKYIATVVTEHYKYILNIQNIDGIQPTYEQAEPHYKGEVPIIEYLNNKMGLGDFELQIPLIDAYNALMSDRVTDKEQFIDAILAIYGTLLSDGDEYDEEGNKISDSADEAQEELKKKKILELPDGTKAEYLTRTFDENGVEILKKAIEQDIHKFSHIPCMSDESFGGNVSGVATTIAVISEDDIKKLKRRALNPETGRTELVPASMTYEEWYKKYVKDNPKAKGQEKAIQNKASDQAQYQKYKKSGIDGVPASFTGFQKLKYQEPEKWELLKKDYRERKKT